ncbi:MAG: DUF4468 domain-containing protein [Bacteroidales bacterium]|jgi:hypothetical protein|nr:DUF4468 domain-containing protein [Bacteroidales bacterium]
MKALYTFLLVTFALMTVTAQEGANAGMPRDEVTGLITYKEVIDEEGSKDTLFNRAASWLHTFYSNPWDAAKVRDQSTGLIKIQHQFRIYDIDDQGIKQDAGMIMYSAKIEFRENRYRIVVDNFVLKQVSRYPVEKWLDESAPGYDVRWKSYLEQIDHFVRDELISSLKEKMKPAQVIQEEEW